MSDVNANINVNVDTSNALSQIKALQRQLSEFYTSISRSSTTAALAQRDLQSNLVNSINALNGFSAEMRTIKTTAESFNTSLEKNKFSMREYFRYAGASTKTFGRLFKTEFDTINKVAEENVKRLQTQYIKLGRDSTGAMKAIAVMPTQLNMEDLSVKTQIAAQRQALFNQLVKQGSTNLLNFGKNTQWAGRQLMVGFTIPLTILGNTAAKSFMDMETAALKFKKVYGDLFTPAEETQKALDAVNEIASSFTKYGIAASSTVSLAADAAAAGFQGLDLQRQVTEATRLQVLGQVDQQKALETTISLQNAFQMSSEDLSGAINFLNAVENQTVVSLDDITTAIPKAAPVVKQLGGDVKDLAFFMAAMKEGGINASEGANALKSGLASLINPTTKAKEMMAGFGINIDQIVNKNAGNVKQTVIEFAQALDNLSDLDRQRAIEQLFGKFQLARLSTLFENVTKTGNQASRVLDLATASTEDLAGMAEKELGMTADSAMNKFRKSVEDLKLALVPVGKIFLETVTPILDFIGNALDKFNNLSSGAKKAITILTVTIGAIGPIALMTFGLLANALANGIKFISILRTGYLKLTGQSTILGEQTEFLTVQQQEAAAVAHSLDQSHAKLTQTFNAEKTAVSQLASAYANAARAASSLLLNNPGMVLPGRTPKKFAKGVVMVPGSGSGDTVPAMLEPGESVIPKTMTKKYRSLIQGMIADNIPGFKTGVLDLGSGRTASIDVATSQGLPGMQRMIDSILDAGNGVANSTEIIDEVLARFASETKVKLGTFIAELDVVTKAVTGKRLETKVFKGAGRERDYSGTSKIEDQIKGNENLTAEYDRAKASAEAAAEAGKRYYAQQGEVIQDGDERLKQAGKVQRAHIVTLQDQTDKLFDEAWDPDMWVAQAAPLNQMSNIISNNFDTQRNQQVYLERLLQLKQEGLIDETQRLEIERKITAGIALTDRELTVQKEVLKRMLASTSDMARTTDAFGAVASMSIGATDYLEQNPAPMGVGTRLVENTQAKERALTEAKYRRNSTADRSQVVLMTPAARAAAEARLTAEGQRLGTSAVAGTATGAGTASPSKKTIPIGEDIGRGLQIGMANQMDDVTRSGEALASAAIAGTRRRIATSPGGTVGPGGVIIPPMPPVSGGGGGSSGGQDDNNKGSGKTEKNLSGLNNKIMASTFALTTLASAGTMSGGKLGDLSNQIMKYSGLLFGLMTVTQLMTKQALLNLTVGRLAMAKQASAFASYGTGLASKSGILGGLARVGVGLLKFAGPIGIATTVATAFYLGFKFYKKKQDEAALAIEGLGKAANLSKTQLEKLGNLYGFTPKETKFSLTPTVAGVLGDKRQKVEETKKLFAEDKEFQDNVKTLKTATKKQADIIFKSMAMTLLGQGATQEAIENIIIALQESAGRTDLKFDFKSIDISTEKGRAGLAKSVKDVFSTYSKDFKIEYDKASKTTQAAADKGMATITNDKLKKSLAFAGNTVSATIQALKAQMESGAITATEFAESFTIIGSKIKDLSKAEGIYLVGEALKTLAPEARTAIMALSNISDQLLVIQARTLGIMVTQQQIDALNVSGGFSYASKNVRDKLQADVDAVLKINNAAIEKMRKAAAAASSTGVESPFARLKKQLEETTKNATNSVTAFKKMREAGVSIADALELSKDPLLAQVLTTEKSKTNIATILKLVKTMNTELQKNALGNFLKGLQGSNKISKDFLKLIPTLQKVGATSEDIATLLNDPDVAQGMIEGFNKAKNKAEYLKKYIDEMVRKRVLEIQIQLSTVQGKGQAISTAAQGAIKVLDARGSLIRRAAETGSYGGNFSALTGVDPSKFVRKDGTTINLSASRQAVETAKANAAAQQIKVNAINQQISDKQRLIDLNNQLISTQQLEVDKINKAIEAQEVLLREKEKYVETTFDKPLEALQNESNVLSNSLSQIEHQQAAINEEYDKQQQAMEELNRLNQESIEQGKTKISIADALSQGDISAAAQAVQDLRAQEAAASAASMQSMFDASRQGALNNVTAGGMNKAQIEERQYQISQQSFKLEQDKAEYIRINILPLQEKIKQLEESKIPFQNEINRLTEDNARIQRDIESIQVNQLYNAEQTLILEEKAVDEAEAKLEADEKIVEEIIAQLEQSGLTKKEWEAIVEKTEAALEIYNAMTSSVEAQAAAAKEIADTFNALAANPPYFTSYEDHFITNYITNIVTTQQDTSGGSGGGGGGTGHVAATFGGRINKYAIGGSVVPGEGLLDKVNALLTPGEFVMNKASSKAYGPLLEAMNNQTFPEMNFGGSQGKSMAQPKMQIDMPSFSKVENKQRSSSLNNMQVSQSQIDNSSAVYNYDVNINVSGNNMDSESVANSVLVKIRQLQDQQVRMRLK